MDLGCDFEGFDVEGDEFFLHGFLVAACQHKEERDAEFEREGLHDEFVAVGEEFAGHIRAREWVIAVRIHAGLVDHEAGAFFRDQVQSLFQKQAGLAFVAGRDPAHDRARAFVGPHAGAADREVEEVWQDFGECGGAIASVFVAIEHEDLGSGIQGRNEGEAVEGAVAAAVRGGGMVEALTHIRGDAALQCHAGSQQIAAVDRQHAIAIVLAPIPEGTLAERTFTGEDAVDIGRGVDAVEIVAGGWLWLDERGASRLGRPFGHEREFPHRGGAGA